jgi:hypothetical protein
MGQESPKVSGTVPGNALGRYYYRAVAMANHVAYLTSATVEVWSYGGVSLELLCDSAWNYDNSCGDQTAVINGQPGTVQVGGTVFSYWLSDGPPGQGSSNYNTLMSLPTTSCRSIDLVFGVTGNSGSASLGIAQGKTAEQSSTGANETISNLKATLDGSPWYLDDWSTNSGPTVYITGSANCWSANGVA